MNELEIAIDKAKQEVMFFVGLHDWPTGERISATYMGHHIINYLANALATQNATEKPAEDASSVLGLVRNQEGDLEGVCFMIDDDEAERVIDSYAQQYHAKECVKCNVNDNAKSPLPCEHSYAPVYKCVHCGVIADD